MRENSIAACLIVKNEEATLERCLASLRPYVDEINVYDTGSTDGTLALLERLARVPGAPIRVVRGEWRDDFAWARTQSFEMASPDIEWLLLVDADEEVVGADVLRQILSEVPPETDGLLVYWDIERDDAGNTVSQAWRERVIRRSAGYRWQGAAHTVLVPPEGSSPNLLPVPRERLEFVHHHDPSRWHPNRALDILMAEVESKGSDHVDPRTLFYLGAELMWRGDFDRAVREFERFLEREDSYPEDLRPAAAHRLASCLRALGNAEQAIEVELDAYERRSNWGETALGLASSYAALERWDDVERWARRALELGEPVSVFFHRPLELRVVPHLRLAEAALARGERRDAVAAFRRACSAASGSRFLEQRLQPFEAAIENGDVAAARARLREAIAHYDETMHSFVRRLALSAQERTPASQ